MGGPLFMLSLYWPYFVTIFKFPVMCFVYRLYNVFYLLRSFWPFLTVCTSSGRYILLEAVLIYCIFLQADRNSNVPIVKTRRCFVYNTQYYQLDTYKVRRIEAFSSHYFKGTAHWKLHIWCEWIIKSVVKRTTQRVGN